MITRRMITRRWRLPALWLTLCLALAWGLAGCAQATLPILSGNANVRTPPAQSSQKGGLLVVVRPDCASSSACGSFSSAMAQSVKALAARAQRGLDVSGATATALDNGDIQVNLPGYSDQQLAVSALTTQGAVQIIDTSGTPLAVGTKVAPNQYPVRFTSAQLDPTSIRPTLDQNNQPIVVFEFQGSARTDFATYTRDNQGGYLTITQDNVVIESAQIQSEIDGQGEIIGLQSMAAAEALAVEMKSPPLPYPVSLVSARALGS